MENNDIDVEKMTKEFLENGGKITKCETPDKTYKQFMALYTSGKKPTSDEQN